jgi:hypothetical protein
MKKSIGIALMLISIFWASDGLAQELNYSHFTKENLSSRQTIAQVILQKAEISEWTKDKSTYVINFKVVNQDNVRQDNIKYAIELYQTFKKQGRVLVERSVFDENMFSLEPNEIMHKRIEYHLPLSLGAQYELELVLATENGMEIDRDNLGVVQQLQTNGIFIDSLKCSLSSELNNFNLLEVAVLDSQKESSLTLKCRRIDNLTDNFLNFSPEFITRNNSIYGEKANKKILSTQKLLPENRDPIFFKVPLINDENIHPIELTLLDKNGEKISNSLYFNYIMTTEKEVVEKAIQRATTLEEFYALKNITISREKKTNSTQLKDIINIVIILVGLMIFGGMVFFIIKLDKKKLKDKLNFFD